MLAVLDKVENESFILETLNEIGEDNLSPDDALGYISEFFQDILGKFSAETNSHNVSTLAWLVSIKLFPDSAYNKFVQQFIDDDKYGEFDDEPSGSDFHEKSLRAYVFVVNAVIENVSSESSTALFEGAKLLRKLILSKLGSTEKSKYWMLDEFQEGAQVFKILENLDENTINLENAYKKICDILRINLVHFSAKENIINTGLIASLFSIRYFQSHPLNRRRLQWLKEGRYGDFIDELDGDFTESDIIYAVPRACALLIADVAEDSDSEMFRRTAQKLYDYIETLDVLPNPDEIRE